MLPSAGTAVGPGRGSPAAGPWMSFYGPAGRMGDLGKVARTFRVLNIDAGHRAVARAVYTKSHAQSFSLDASDASADQQSVFLLAVLGKPEPPASNNGGATRNRDCLYLICSRMIGAWRVFTLRPKNIFCTARQKALTNKRTSLIINYAFRKPLREAGNAAPFVRLPCASDKYPLRVLTV